MTGMNTSDLVVYLKNREFSLFLGSGASVPGGGPTGSQLLDEVRKKYSEIEARAKCLNATSI
jgi:hypothetical protein